MAELDRETVRKIIKDLDLKRRARIWDEALSLGDELAAGAETQLAKALAAMQRTTIKTLSSFTYLSNGAIDPAAPQNAPLLAALRSDLQSQANAAAVNAGQLFAGQYSQFMDLASKLLIAEYTPDIISLQAIEDAAGRIKNATQQLSTDVFRAFQSGTMTGELSQSELVDRVKELTGKTLAQSKQAVHDSLMSGYRQTALADANAADVDIFIYEGPLDERTRQDCFEQVGKIRTRAEWVEIGGAEIFQWGLGYNCRHKLNAVTPVMARKYGDELTSGQRFLANPDAARLSEEIERDYGGDIAAWFKDQNGSAQREAVA